MLSQTKKQLVDEAEGLGSSEAVVEESSNVSVTLPAYDQNWALFFDIDGTLADIAETPDDAYIPVPTLNNLRLLSEETTLALVSGRSIDSIDRLTEPTKFLASGQHGLEIRFSKTETTHMTHHVSLIKDAAEEVKVFVAAYPELIAEYKGLSIAVHYRARPDLGEIVRDFLATLMKGHEDALCIQQGKLVWELKLCGANKGTAITAYMKRPEFHGKTPVFFGDDKTDEDAHKVVNAMGGISVQIGAASRHAHYRLDTPQDLRNWLNDITNKWADQK